MTPDDIFRAVSDQTETDYRTWRKGRIVRQWEYPAGQLRQSKILVCPHCGEKGEAVPGTLDAPKANVTHVMRGIRVVRWCQRHSKTGEWSTTDQRAK